MDGEKTHGANKYPAESQSPPPPPVYGDSEGTRGSVGRRIIDSFKRDPNAHATPKGTVGADGKVYDLEGAARATAESPLARKLKGRHLQMIAIGGSIGEMGFLRCSMRLAVDVGLLTSRARHGSLCRFR